MNGGRLCILSIVALLISSWPAARPARAADGTVGNGSPASCTADALRTTFDAVQASGGGTLYFDCGPAPHAIVVAETLRVSTTVTFEGGAAGQITLSGGNARRIFVISPTASLALSHMTLALGWDRGDGGCIHSQDASVVLQSTTVRDCTAAGYGASGGSEIAEGPGTAPDHSEAPSGVFDETMGGGISATGGSVTLVNSEVLSSSATFGGGIGGSLPEMALTLIDSRVAGNEAERTGGGIYWAGPMTLTNSLVEHNRTLTYMGGGVYKHDYGTSHISGLKLLGTRVYSNTAATHGGGMAGQGTAVVWRSAFEQNRSAGGVGGGGLHYSGTVLLDFSRLSGNSAAANGGGLYLAGGLVNGWANTIEGNAAGGKGGGLAQYGGWIQLYYSTFNSNRAELYGGGVHNEEGMLLMGNVTVSGNSAGQHGGGFFTAEPITLTHVTIANNQAPTGGGIARSAGAVPYWMYNTLLADNSASSASTGNCSGPSGTSAFSLSTDSTCSFGPERSNINAALGPLRVNGGPAAYQTPNHLPLAGGAAIDAASGSYCYDRDQRWAARPVGLACDVGAVESGAQVPWLWGPLIVR
jgi:hypothetical protein